MRGCSVVGRMHSWSKRRTRVRSSSAPQFQTITSLKKKKFAAPPGQVEVVSGCAQMGRNVARPATISAKVESAISLHATKQKRARTAGGARRLYQNQGQLVLDKTAERSA